MRSRLLIGVGALALCACARGRLSEDGWDDAGEVADTGGALDVVHPPPPGRDASTALDAAEPADAGGDSSAPPDASAAVQPDATAPVDAGSDAPSLGGGVGESCSNALDVSSGGTFQIDTCTLADRVATTCGSTAAAMIFRALAPTNGSTYQLTFPSGWVLQELDDTCAPMFANCGSSGTWGMSGSIPGGFWYFAVEPMSGACGTATVTVTRVM